MTKSQHKRSPAPSSSPAQDSAQQRSVEALRGRQAALHLPHSHLVFGGGAEQGQPTRDGAEDLGRVGHGAHAQAVLGEGQRRHGGAVQLGGDGNWEESEGGSEPGGADGGIMQRGHRSKSGAAC